MSNRPDASNSILHCVCLITAVSVHKLMLMRNATRLLPAAILMLLLWTNSAHADLEAGRVLSLDWLVDSADDIALVQLEPSADLRHFQRLLLLPKDGTANLAGRSGGACRRCPLYRPEIDAGTSPSGGPQTERACISGDVAAELTAQAPAECRRPAVGTGNVANAGIAIATPDAIRSATGGVSAVKHFCEAAG